MASPQAHVITRWLGADVAEPRPHVARFEPPGPGVVLVCSDGLWNYEPEAAAPGRACAAGRAHRPAGCRGRAGEVRAGRRGDGQHHRGARAVPAGTVLRPTASSDHPSHPAGVVTEVNPGRRLGARPGKAELPGGTDGDLPGRAQLGEQRLLRRVRRAHRCGRRRPAIRAGQAGHRVRRAPRRRALPQVRHAEGRSVLPDLRLQVRRRPAAVGACRARSAARVRCAVLARRPRPLRRSTRFPAPRPSRRSRPRPRPCRGRHPAAAAALIPAAALDAAVGWTAVVSCDPVYYEAVQAANGPERAAVVVPQ